MPVYVVIAALAVSLSLPVLWYALTAGEATTRQVTRNLVAGMAETGDLRRLVLSQSPLERLVRPVLHRVAVAARRATPAGIVSALERRLQLAGGRWSIEHVLIAKVVLAVAMLGAGIVLAASRGWIPALLAAAGAGALGYLAPDLVLARLAAARQLAIGNELPDTLDQLTICVEAGLGFDAALARVAASGHGPLAQEITRVLQELRLGVPRTDALNSMLARTDVPGLRQLVHDVVHAATYGVPIARVLRIQAGEQREKRRFRAEERAMKLPVKVIFPLVACILPALFIVVLAPAFLKISEGFG